MKNKAYRSPSEMRGFFMFKLYYLNTNDFLYVLISRLFTPFQMLCYTMWGLNKAIYLDNLVETIVSSIFLK